MKGLETQVLIAIILLIAAIGVIIVAFYPYIKTSTESQDATSKIASACYKWVSKNCPDEFFTEQIDEVKFLDWCKKKYGDDDAQAKQMCKQFCQC